MRSGPTPCSRPSRPDRGLSTQHLEPSSQQPPCYPVGVGAARQDRGVGMTMASLDGDLPGRGMRVAFAGVAHWHFSVDASYLALAQAAGVEIVGLSDDEALAKRRG